MDPHTLWYVLAAVLVLAGIAGMVLPALPGPPLMFAGMLVAAWADGFDRVGPAMLALLGLLALLAAATDFVASALGARRVGAGPAAVWGAAIGTFAGLWFMPVGLVAGPFLGALAGEFWHCRQLLRSARVGFATWLGLLVGAVLKLALAFSMLALFVAAWFL